MTMVVVSRVDIGCVEVDYAGWVSYLLGNNLFWSIFEKRDVPKDGHCFIHALISSLSTLSPDLPSLTYDHVLTLIKNVMNSNNEKYSLLLYDQGEIDIGKILDEYINDKNYNEQCGVLVPTITANAVNKDLVIFKEKDDGLCYELITSHECKGTQKRPIFLFEQGHYRALAYQAGAGDTDTGDDEYRNSDSIVDRMNVYKEGFCSYSLICPQVISTGKITTYANHHGSS